jgi:biopolymer transport protein ExbB
MRLTTILTVALALLLAADASAEATAGSFEAARSGVDERLESSLQELSKERQRIAKEKIPLSKEVSRLEKQVLELRREQARLVEVNDSRTIDLGSLRKQVDAMREHGDFVDSRLSEFVRDFEGRLDISEVPRYEELTAAARLSGKNVNLDVEGKRATQLAVVQAGIDRVREQLGGHVYPGQALSSEGVLSEGWFIALGPTVLYASQDGTVSGLVEHQLNAADPVVVPLPGGLGDDIAKIAEGNAGLLPFDSTLGKALKVEKARKSAMQYVAEGGVVGYVIIGLGAAALLITLLKCLEILRFPVAEPGQIDSVLEELSRGSQAAAAKQAEQVPGIAGEMLATGVAHADESRSVLEELLFEKVLRVRPTLERFLPFLAITAAAAPLLGLLGTVIGMIKTFQLITIFGTGDAKSLSSGISEALVTTALGLVVAIPTLILHGALSRMAKRKLGLLEELSVAFVNGVTAIRAALGRQGVAGGPGPVDG